MWKSRAARALLSRTLNRMRCNVFNALRNSASHGKAICAARANRNRKYSINWASSQFICRWPHSARPAILSNELDNIILSATNDELMMHFIACLLFSFFFFMIQLHLFRLCSLRLSFHRKKLIILEPIAANISHSTHTEQVSAYRTDCALVCTFAPPIFAIWIKWQVQPVRIALYLIFRAIEPGSSSCCARWMMWICAIAMAHSWIKQQASSM